LPQAKASNGVDECAGCGRLIQVSWEKILWRFQLIHLHQLARHLNECKGMFMKALDAGCIFAIIGHLVAN
jgi:hypothetical protein